VSSKAIAILNTGLVTSVGLTAAASCAAIRAKLSNPTETRFVDSAGEWIMAHSVGLNSPWSGRTKLSKMASLAIRECLADVPQDEWRDIPVLLCIAERERPGRTEGIDEDLFAEIQREMSTEFSADSMVVPHGRAAVCTALASARNLIADQRAPFVLIAAADSLLNWRTLSAYERADRLLTANNSNGFIAGEGAAAMVLGHVGTGPQLVLSGIGFATEPATISSDEPLRGEGLARAIKAAVLDAGCEVRDLDFRITDLSGEQYYFKEAALALSRTLRLPKEDFPIWHPSECIGETGSVNGVAMMAVALSACRKNYAPGPNILCHVAGDDGKRAAGVLNFRAN
jgi:3-oxoacyl-[acyl-carrier-protein] synthase-1